MVNERVMNVWRTNYKKQIIQIYKYHVKFTTFLSWSNSYRLYIRRIKKNIVYIWNIERNLGIYVSFVLSDVCWFLYTLLRGNRHDDLCLCLKKRPTIMMIQRRLWGRWLFEKNIYQSSNVSQPNKKIINYFFYWVPCSELLLPAKKKTW